MPLLPEIYWQDGDLLRPQHLQAFQRHCSGLVSRLARINPFGYGVQQLTISKAGVGNWQFEVESCEIVMKEGTVVIANETADVPPCTFEATTRTLGVWIGIPMHDAGAPNAGRRFRVKQIELVDENSGDNPQPIGVKRLAASIYIGDPPPDSCESLKIAELQKVQTQQEESRRYELSTRYVPPCLTLDASPELGALVRDILHSVETRNDELHEILGARRDILKMQEPEMMLRLQASNSVLPVLRQLAGQKELHPFTVYLQLCRLVGDLAIFGRDRRPPRIDPYDHDDLYGAFARLKDIVVKLLARQAPRPVDRTAFTLDEDGKTWRVKIPARYLEPGVQLLLGIETEQPMSDVVPLFKQGRTCLASSADLEDWELHRIPGVGCDEDVALHPSLRDREGLVFLGIQTGGVYWKRVLETRDICLVGVAAAQPDMKFHLYVVGLGEEQ